jgi:hypothetical protein
MLLAMPVCLLPLILLMLANCQDPKTVWRLKCVFSDQRRGTSGILSGLQHVADTAASAPHYFSQKGRCSMPFSKTQEREQTEFSNRPQPISGKLGPTIIGPTNPTREAENPDTLVPPRVDHGTTANLRWSFADSHMHLSEGG